MLNKSLNFNIAIVLGWRNLWRNTRRTSIMLCAIILGIFAMVVLSSLLRGIVQDMFERGINSLPGHVQVHHRLFLDDPNIDNRFQEPNTELLALLNSSKVSSWSSRLKIQAAISSERQTRGVEIIALDPTVESLKKLGIEVIEGRLLIDNNDKGIIIGQRLAEKLQTKVGRRLVITSQDPHNNLVDRGFRIIGVYQAELPLVEERIMYAAKGSFQKFLLVPNEISELAIFVNNTNQLQSFTAQLQSLVAVNVLAQPWQDINAYLSTSVQFMDSFVYIWIFVVFIAMSFGLANTLTMAIFERFREIGLMMALGMRPQLIRWQLILESFFLLLIGLAIGDVLALLALYSLRNGIDISAFAQGMEMAGMGSHLIPVLRWDDFLFANISVLILGLITCLLPAWRASKYNPVQALTSKN